MTVVGTAVAVISRTALVCAALIAGAGGCGDDPLKVHPVDRADPRDYGRTALLHALEVMAAEPESPKAYATLVSKIEALRSEFTEEVNVLAERKLVFAAYGPMNAYFGKPYPEQLEALGLTVWPTAFEMAVRERETPLAFLDRACSTTLALECKFIVPQHRAQMLSRYAWKRFKERARAAYAACETCTGDKRYLDTLAGFERRDEVLFTEIAKLDDSCDTTAWPVAGENATPWTELPLFEYATRVAFEGTEVNSATWRKAMMVGRNGREVLGLYVRPDARIEVVRAIATDAAAAGFRKLALLARQAAYPYDERAYVINIGRHAKGRRVRVRDFETVQVLIQALDANLASGTHVRL